jgi:membrane-associated phospholipid phosphatase
MRLQRELDYSLQMVSALGAYPLHLILMLLFLKLERYEDVAFLGLGFLTLYALGYPLRVLIARNVHPPAKVMPTPLPTSSSFPSYHVARATFLSLFLATLFAYQLDVIVLVSALTLTIAYARVRYGHHFCSDVLGGAVLGVVMFALSSWLV